MSIVSRQGGGYSGFSPSDIGGLSLWLDAADESTLTLSGSNVSEWRDKSINAYTTSTFYNAPSYDPTTNAIVFAGSNGFTVPYSASLNVESAFIVIRASNMANAATMIGPANANNARQFLFAGGRLMTTASDVANYLSTGVVLNSSTTYSVGFVNTGSTLTHFVNGGVYATRDIATNYASGRITCIGSRSFSTTGVHYLIGSIHEIIVFNTAVSTTERQQIEGYLAHKWGLYPNLPTAHPFLRYKPIARRFQPSDTGSLALWLDAADSSTLTLSGSNVTQWRDKSGQERHITQSTTSNQPTYSSILNAVVFTGTQFLNIPNALSAITPTYTIFVVERRASANVMFFIGQYNLTSGNTGLILGYNATNISHHTIASISDCQVTIPSYAGSSEPTKLNCYQYTGTTRATFINGGSLSTTQSFSATLPVWSNPNVGIGFGTAFGYIGNIYEIIFFNTSLSAQQRQQVEAYLAHKWGLRNSLPTSHIFRSQIPQVPILSGPLTVPGCALWLDAADPSTITQSGGTISQWRSKGTFASVATTTLYSAPSYNASEMGVNYTSNNAFNITNATTVSSNRGFISMFLVGTMRTVGNLTSFFYFSFANTTGGQRTYFNVALTGGIYVLALGIRRLDGNGGVTLFGTDAVPTNQRILICMEMSYATAQAFFYINGTVGGNPSTTLGAGNTSDTSSLAVSMGNRPSPGYLNYDGFMNEVLIYNEVYTPQHRQQIEAYLAHKWGLVANLPPAHPFKKFRP